MEDIKKEKKEDELNYGFERFQGANPDRIKILKYNLKNVVQERQNLLNNAKIRPNTAFKKEKQQKEFFITNRQMQNN
jgi:hypothetical protein